MIDTQVKGADNECTSYQVNSWITNITARVTSTGCIAGLTVTDANGETEQIFYKGSTTKNTKETRLIPPNCHIVGIYGRKNLGYICNLGFVVRRD